MSITVYAAADNVRDLAPIFAAGSEAEISKEAATEIANFLEGKTDSPVYPAKSKDEEEFYGSYIPDLGIAVLADDVQARFYELLAGNEEAIALANRARDNRLRVIISRGDVTRKYTIRLTRESDTNVDLNLCSGNWKHFRNTIGVDGNNTEAGYDCGELNVDEVESALTKNDFFIRFADDYTVRLAARLRELIAYAKSIGAKELHWA